MKELARGTAEFVIVSDISKKGNEYVRMDIYVGGQKLKNSIFLDSEQVELMKYRKVIAE